VAGDAADPELRKVATSCQKTLTRIELEGKEKLAKKLDKEAALQSLTDLLAASADGKKALVPEAAASLDYAAALCANLTNNKNFDIEAWRDVVLGAYLGPFVAAATLAPIAQVLADKCFAEVQVKSSEYFDDEEGDELCNCEFSLAYGAKILLNNAALRLKRGRRYGLCGPNGVGKSTLMRAISNGQVDGFPPKEILRTVYVEHDIDSSVSDVSCVEFVFSDADLQAAVPTTKEDVAGMLSSVG
ncbi:Elongation factor 3B, partial [Tetrabaena socialis]